MGAENTGGRRADGPIRFVPGATGIVVLLTIGLLVAWVAPERRIAVGFVVPILGAAVADAVLGARTLTAARVRISTLRSVAAAPDVITFQVASDRGTGPARLLIGPMQEGEPASRVTLPSEAGTTTVAWAAGSPYAAFAVRHLIESTRFGLVVARRYTVTELPAGAWRIGPPVGLTTDVPLAGEDLTRLREYLPGDRMSRVAWPTTARTGRLHVRSEAMDADEAVVVVDCGENAAEAETALRFAAGVIDELLGQGLLVRLITRTHRGFYEGAAERMLAAPTRSPQAVVDEMQALSGPAPDVTDAWVGSNEEMIRRLATAEFGPPLPAPAGPYVRVDATGVSTVS